MSKLPPMPMTTDAQVLGDLQRRIGDLERVIQQLEGVVSPYDGSTQSGMFATGSIGGGDVGAGQLAGSHFSSLTIAAILSSSGTQLQGNTYLGAGAQMVLASGVSQPITTPGLALVTGGSLVAGTPYYVSFSWYDGVNETTVYAPAASIKAVGTSLSITVTLPIAPTGASQARIYMDTAAFGVAGGKLQQALAVSTTAQTQVTITAFNSAGGASISATTFSAANAAKIQPASAVDSSGASYGWSIEGNGRARFLGPTVNTQFWLYDDFYYVSGAYPGTGTGPFAQWGGGGLQGAGASVVLGTSSSTDPGVMQVTTGTTTTGHAGLRTNGCFALGVARVRFSVYFNIDTALPTATNSFTVLLGLLSTSGAGVGPSPMVAADTGIIFEYGTATTSTTFGLGVANGVAKVHKNAATQPTVNTWHFAEFEIDAGRTTLNWWLDGVVQTAFTSADLALTSITALMGIYLGIAKTADGAGIVSRTVSVDTVALFGDYVSG